MQYLLLKLHGHFQIGNNKMLECMLEFVTAFFIEIHNASEFFALINVFNMILISIILYYHSLLAVLRS